MESVNDLSEAVACDGKGEVSGGEAVAVCRVARGLCCDSVLSKREVESCAGKDVESGAEFKLVYI